MGWIAKLIVEVLKGALASFLAGLRRDQEMKQAGREEVIDDAHKEADVRKAAADKLEDDFLRMSPDERERLRVDKDIYRD